MRVHVLAACAVAVCSVLGACGDENQSSARTEAPLDEPVGTAGAAGIRIDDDVLVGERENILVACVDLDVCEAAVTAAGDRFMSVNLRGVETDPDSYEDEDYEDESSYTPNYVSVERRPEGVMLYIDCKGYISDAMGETFRRVLREELAASGVEVADVSPFEYPAHELD